MPRLPSQCMVCRAWPCADILCSNCRHRFDMQPLRCTGCALSLPGLSPEQPRCGACLRQAPVWMHAYAWVDYSYPWNHLITQWKFGQQAALAQHFARWMQKDPKVQQMLMQADAILAIPLSRPRLRERGYNPAAQLAQKLQPSKYLPQALQRVRHTPPQSDLTRTQRMRNLRQAFDVPPSQRAAIADRRLLLIDDVMTTGATLSVATHCLLQAGASEVSVLCMARTP